MKIIAYPILALLFVGLLEACDSESLTPPIEKKPGNRVQLSNLVPGQHSQFVGYRFDCLNSTEASDLVKDTLNLKVIEKEGRLFFEESYTRYSPSYSATIEPVTYPVSYEAGKLHLPERGKSLLFYFYGNDEIELMYQLKSMPPVYQEGCRLVLNGEPFIGNEITQIDQFDLGEVHLTDKIVVSCVPIQLALNAYLMYDNHQLYLSHTFSHSTFWDEETKEVRGWRLLD